MGARLGRRRDNVKGVAEKPKSLLTKPKPYFILIGKSISKYKRSVIEWQKY